jgi:ATP-dependent Clp protease ATP-binding subunit ClpA
MLTPELETAIRNSLEDATRRGHEFAALEHLLLAMLADEKTADVIKQCGGSVSRLSGKLEAFLESDLKPLPEGERERAQPTLAFARVIQRAVNHVLGAGKEKASGSNVLVAMFSEQDSHAVTFLKEEGITRLDVVSYISHGISKLLPAKTTGMPGQGGERPLDEEEDEEAPVDPLTKYAVNLNERARAGEIDPLIGRGPQIERALHVLARRRKNNPLFIGDAGVGKTAIVEGLARRIELGEAPAALAGAVIYALDMGSMVAGTRYRGDFEERFKAVIAALQEQENAIVFIDELHTIVGAGAASGGAMDASNLIKPALANGRLRCIGTTTHKEFRSYIEKDRALARRFQPIEVEEPSVEETVKVLQGLKPRYEEFHGVAYTDEALQAAADLSARYLTERRLPDKAIDLIDEAGAAAKLKDKARKNADGKRRVGEKEIETVVATMARIPPKRVAADDRKRLQDLEGDLRAKIYGQDAAVARVAQAIKMNRAGLGQPERPIGCFLFAGPTGVGKTELAKQLAEILGVAFLRFDMSEYMERHTVSRLIGAPPGYVGFDQGGLLTDAIHQTPHAVLLLDEIEKAHQDLFNLLLQVMDHGSLTDNNGRKSDFRHVVLIMTSNVGARELSRHLPGFGLGSAGADRLGDTDEAYKRMFSPEFRNRLDAKVDFAPLDPAVMGRIVDKFVAELATQLADRKVKIELSDAARAYLAKKGYDPLNGARPLSRVIADEVKRPLTDELLFGKLSAGGGTVKVGAGADGEKLTFGFD